MPPDECRPSTIDCRQTPGRQRSEESQPIQAPLQLGSRRSKPSDRSWALRFAVLVMLATTLPYLLGFAVQGREWRFTGFVFGVEDGNSYIAKMWSGAAGNWLFRTPYTTFPQRGILAFLPYILLGKLAQPPGMHEQLVVLFHLFRFGAGVLAILATYDFLALFLAETHWRRFSLILATLGGGLGWAFVLSGRPVWRGSLPLEFYSPESFGFLSLFGLPHLALSRALLLWGFVSLLAPRAVKPGQMIVGSESPTKHPFLPGYLRIGSHPGVKSGACWLMLGLVQPLYTIVAWAVTGAHLLLLAVRCAWHIRNSRVEEAHPILGWEEWTEAARRAIWAVTISSPPVLYTLVASTLDPFFKAWTAQNLILSPHPLHYLLAYGLPVAAILAGLPYLRRVFYEGAQSGPYTGQAARPDLLAVWLLALPFLVYAPYPLQRRLAEGAWVALIALALTALQGRSIRLAGLPLLLLFPSTLLLWTGGLAGAGKPSQPLFRPTAETAAFEFVASSLELGAVVLASYDTANALPAWAPVQVIVGHGPESPGYTGLRLRLERFFQAATPDVERRAMLQEFQIQAVYWGPTERILGGWDPRSASYLRLIYDEDGYSIFTPVKSDEN